ncbi:MAG: Crp/Fnr family transcriptional regulator [Cytophagales bacterium]|nr:Crp/Fnr family transcriptional regulator [Cytophagales bacterium]
MPSFNILGEAIRQMIKISDAEMEDFFELCTERTFRSKEFLSEQGSAANEIFFITKGLTRSLITDGAGVEHTIHFSTEYQFICDYTSFMMKTPATNGIQALELTQVVVMPRVAIDWGYSHLQQGDKLGRLIAEYYFIYFDSRLKNQYLFTPAQRYENITRIFPNIHNRVPQHMIASYLGVSPVHLSRLKNSL